MRSFNAVVLPTRLVVPDRQAQISDRSRVGSELVGDENTWSAAAFLQELAHETKRSALVAPALDENVEDLAMLVDGAPQIHSLSADRDEHLIEMPQRMSRAAMPAQPVRDLGSKLRDPERPSR